MQEEFKIIGYILSWIVYYILFKIFVVNKKIKQIENENYDKSIINEQKKYLNAKCIVNTLMFISITIVLEIFHYVRIYNSILILIAAAVVGKSILFIGDKVINKEYNSNNDK